MKDKLRLIFVPFVVTLFSLVIGYTFLHWLLVIETQVIQFDEGTVKIGIPFFVAGIIAVAVFASKVKIFSFKTEEAKRRMGLVILFFILLCFPLIVSLHYIDEVAGGMTQLNTISDINEVEQTKFYRVKDFYLDMSRMRLHDSDKVGGKNDADYIMSYYLVIPMFNSASDTLEGQPVVWLGKRYSKTVYNLDSESYRRREIEKFNKEFNNELSKTEFETFSYLQRINYPNKRVGFTNAVLNDPYYPKRGEVLEAVYEPFEERTGDLLLWTVLSSLFSTLVCLAHVYFMPTDDKELQRIKAGGIDLEAQEDRKFLVDHLLLKRGFVVTPLLMYAYIGVFIAMWFSGIGFASFSAKDLIPWGACYGPLVEQGEWWRLFTSMFVHGGLMHVLTNIYGLWIAGILLEPRLGKFKYCLVYIATELFANIASLWWDDTVVSVGASGAIFGLYGVVLTFWWSKRVNFDYDKVFVVLVGLFVGISLLGMFKSGIDHAGHIGGLLSGMFVGLVLLPLSSKTGENNNVQR